MSRTYSFKPENKAKKYSRYMRSKRVNLADYEIEFIETMVGTNIRIVS